MNRPLDQVCQSSDSEEVKVSLRCSGTLCCKSFHTASDQNELPDSGGDDGGAARACCCAASLTSSFACSAMNLATGAINYFSLIAMLKVA